MQFVNMLNNIRIIVLISVLSILIIILSNDYYLKEANAITCLY